MFVWPEQVRSPDQGQVTCVHVGLVAEGGQMSQVLGQVLQSSNIRERERCQRTHTHTQQELTQRCVLSETAERCYSCFYLKCPMGSSLITCWMFLSRSCSSFTDTASWMHNKVHIHTYSHWGCGHSHTQHLHTASFT